MAVIGDKQALRERLIAAGIPSKSILPSSTGVVVGRTQAKKAQEALAGPVLKAPTQGEVLANQNRAAQADKLDERAQIKRESEAGAGLFQLQTQDGRQDTTGNLFDAAQNAEIPEQNTPSAGQKSEKTKQTAAITDFGEKIGGAKKDLWTGFSDELGAVSDDDIANHPLSKVWPAPDYQALIDGGASPEVVAFVRAARDEVPAKPRKGYKVRGWAEKVRTLRGFAMDLMAGKLTMADVRGQLEKSGSLSRSMQGFLGRVDLYQAVGHAKSLEGIQFGWHHFTMYRGQENVSMWVVEKDAAASTFSNWPSEIATGKTKEEAIEAFRKAYDKLGSDKEAKKGVQFDIISTRGQTGYWIAKKLGRNYVKVHGPLATVQEARSYRDNNQAALVEKLEKVKEIPAERRDVNEPRVGEDMRNGADVTPEFFSDTFGFRGVEFGNWVEQGRRQQDLNNAFDALMDMAGVLGLPPKAMSLNGQLALAFGARGGGGAGIVAAAHYEPDKVVINLTKKNGAGSLGHEWWHAVDNYFAKMRKGDFMTTAIDVRLASRDAKFVPYEGVRQEMVMAFGNVVKSINLTNMKTRSAVLDGKRSKDYWTTGEELSARAFEAYLIAKLQDQNASNDYLANILSEDAWNAAAALGLENENSYPYPIAKEVPGIRAAFDQFFQTVQTKETEQGVAIYSTSSRSVPLTAGNWIDVGVIAKEVENRIGQFAHQPPVRIRDTAYGVLPGAVEGDAITGAVHKGVIYLFRDQLASVREVQRTLFHELLHYGLRKIFSRQQFIEEMQKLANRDASIHREATRWAATNAGRRAADFGGEEYAFARGVDEALAQLAEPNAGAYMRTDVISQAIVRATKWLADLAEKYGFKGVAAELRGYKNQEAREFIQQVFRRLETVAEPERSGWMDEAEDAYRSEDSKQSRPMDADMLKRMFTPMAPLSVAETQAAVADMVKGWKNGPRLRVVASPSELPGNAPADARGQYLNGTAYVVASNHRSAGGVQRTLAHEAIAHYGLPQMLGGIEWQRLMRNIQQGIARGDKALIELRDDVRQAYVDEQGQFNLTPEREADEIAARAVEVGFDVATGEFRTGFEWVKRVYSRIAQFLRNLDFDIAFTNAELQGMLARSQRFLVNPAKASEALVINGAEPVATLARDRATGLNTAIIGSALGAANSHPQYAEAKAGDVEAAVAVARDLVTPELVQQVRAVIGDRKPLIVPVVAEEAAGRNKIPRAAAEVLAQKLGLETAEGLSQANRPRRTGMDGIGRIFSRVEFDGPVQAGQDYLLLDDTLTQGGTFAALAAHIEAGGGRVVGAVALTGKQYSSKIALSKDTLQELREKHGDIEPDFQAATGYGFDALTESEARYLANFKPADILRTRIAEEGRRAGEAENPPFADGLTQGPAYARGPMGWDAPEPTKTDRVIYELQDSRIDLKRVQEAIEATGGKIAEQFDARLAETLYPGRVATRSQKFLDDEIKPLLNSMARHNVQMDELADFLHARGAKERNEQIAKVNPDLPDGGAGKNTKGVLMTTEAARQHLAALSESKRAVLTAMAKRVDEITAGTRQLLVTEGLEKQETIDAWEGAYKHYVPMFRDEAEAGQPHPVGNGMSVRGSASKRAVGSTKEVTNILAHVLMQREAAITRAEKNRVAVALYGLALSSPNPDFWATIRPSMKPDAIVAELQRMGVDPLLAQSGMQAAPTITTVDPVLDRVVNRPNPMYKSLPGAIVLKVNGDDRVLMLNVNDPRGLRMAESLKNLDGLTRLDIAGSVVGHATRWMAAVNTQYNPAFGMVNLTRDALGGAVNLQSTPLRGQSLKVLAMTPSALKGIGLELTGKPSGEWGKLFRQFQADGGQTGYRDLFKDANERTQKLEAELKRMEKAGGLAPSNVAHKMLDGLDVFNTTLENGVRLAAYKAALESGMSRAQAARLGRELTVDFNRKGRAGREIGPLYAFFNASVQGSARTIETLSSPAGKKIIVGGLLLGVLQALVLAAAGYDDDEIPEFFKARAFFLPLPWLDGKKYLAIPLPLGLHVLPNTGRVLMELAMDPGKNPGAKLFNAVGEIAGAFNPFGGGNIFTADGLLKTVAPTVVDPIIELGTNKNFSGVPIEREPYGENDTRPGHERAREKTLRQPTGQAYTEISRILNTMTGGDASEAGFISPTPERLRYLAQVVGGGVLRETEKLVDSTISAAKGEGVKPAGVPLLGRFYGEVDDAQVQTRRYHDNLKWIERAENVLAAAESKGDGDKVNQVAKERPEVALKDAKSQVESKIKDLNKKAMQTIDNPEAIKNLDEVRTNVMRVLNDAAAEVDRPRREATLGGKIDKALAD